MTNAIHFDHPPLDEVVCGVHFAGVKWSDIHFGLYYTDLGGRYPHTQSRPPISLFESGGSEGLQIELMTEPQLPLFWYESPDSPFLLQVQKDAFFVNWRRQSGTFIYPHFHTREGEEQGVWERFVSEWETFRTFCDKQAIGTPEVLACHLAYINHMVHGETWDVPTDLVRWFHFLAGVKRSNPVATLNMTIIYQARKLPLRINVRPAIRIGDKKQLFIIDFIVTAKLTVESDLQAWFDAAHQVIRDEFLAQTTQEAHQQWGLSSG
ncbi:MAG: TIGR04255 family protein [Candidatus Entotheonellia bacterium]